MILNSLIKEMKIQKTSAALSENLKHPNIPQIVINRLAILQSTAIPNIY